MVLAADLQVESRFEQLVAGELWRPPVVAVPEIAGDLETRLRTARFIGSVVLEDISVEQQLTPAYTLMDAIHQAAGGDREAHAMVRSNVAADVVERTIKSGHITKVRLETDEQGQILQYGQTAADIQKNSLRYAADNAHMRRRTEAETRNMFRIDEAYRQGLLDDYAFVVFSPAPGDMTITDMAETGFFTDTMSCAIQLTTADGGELSVESAFVAGKPTWDAPRHDLETLGKVGAAWHVEFAGKTTTEILDTPLLVHKSLLPNGVTDVVRLYDDQAGGTFFGEAKPRQDYVTYKQACKEREKSFQPRVDAITKQLIAEAHTINSPQTASRRLGKLSEAQMLEQSIVDASIDSRVFGQAAAWHIEQARYYVEVGQVHNLSVILDEAKLVAKSSSCPGGVDSGDSIGVEVDESQSSGSSEKLDDCEFVSKQCPKCHKKNVKTIVKKGVYYGDCGCHS